MDETLKETGHSRKYQLAIAGLLLITTGWVAGNWSPALQSTFSELISGIMGVLVLYYTGNVGNKFVVGKHMVDTVKARSGHPNANTTSITTSGGTNVTESK